MEAARSCEKSTRLHGVTPRCVYNLVHLCSLCYFFPPVALLPNAGLGLLILDVSRSHTTTHHSRQDSSGRVISSSQRPLPDNTQHLQPPVGYEPTISAGERLQTYWASRFAIETSNCDVNIFTTHLRIRYCQLTVRVLVNMHIVTSATCLG